MLLLRIVVSKEWRGQSEESCFLLVLCLYERVCNFYFQPVLVFV